MTDEAEFNAQVDAELNAKIEAELQAELARKRAEIAFRLRREAAAKEYDRINAKHPIEGPLAGLTPEQHRARLAAMDARAKADAESMDRSNSRPVPGGLLDQRSRASLTPGSEGLEIRSSRSRE
jgi:hypothetical protein